MQYRISRSSLKLSSGFLFAIFVLTIGVTAQTNLGVVSIDGVTNSSPQLLRAGSTHQVAIRYDFTALPVLYWGWGSSTCFELYSPDGANWVNLRAYDGPAVLALPAEPIVVRYHTYYRSTDNGASYTATPFIPPAPDSDPYWSEEPGGSSGVNSRVAYSLITASAGRPGFPSGAGGTNEIAMFLEFETLVVDEGRTICLDTVNGSGTVPWEWTAGPNTDLPRWDNGLGNDGPRCWAIGSCPNMDPSWCGNVTTGNVSFPYCGQGSYQLCVQDGPPCYGEVTYGFAPGFDNGNFGSVDPISGLWTWSGVTVPQTGFLDIEFQFYGSDYSLEHFVLHVAIMDAGCDCCAGRVGDVNNSGEDEPTIADVTMLIDHLFITRPGLACYREGDINQSGGLDPYVDDITIADVSILIDYLFITGPTLGLPNCP